MCGICGMFGGSDKKIVKGMLSVLSHRGPDDEYLIEEQSFCMGVRRLSIIDVERGRQPLCNEDRKVWVCQNGEIYNFPSLKEGLLKKGHRFRTRCDTEILPHLYEEKDIDFIYLLNGMYAIALWDSDNNKGLLIRDRVGKKPLYYWLKGRVLYFASEIKALLKIPDLKRKLNYEALHYYLSYKHIPCPLSIFEDVYQLPPGSLLFYQEGKISIQRYWKPSFLHIDIDEEEAVERIMELLRAGVRRRLISDVPIGFFLSGGIDSGLSTVLAAEVSPSKIDTFTLIYPEELKSEGKELDRKFAKEVSQVYGTKHHEELIDFSDFKEELPHIIGSFDEPFCGVLSTYFLSRLISKYVKVTLSGDGADELFGSYLSHRLAFPIHDYLSGGQPSSFEFSREYLEEIAEKETWKWRSKLLVFSDEEKKRLYSEEIGEMMRRYKTDEHLMRYFKELTADDPLNQVLEAEFFSFLPDQVLTYVDRLSMAHSLEVRTPYLDYEFVEFVASLPGHLKIKDGETKYILKKVALKYFPEEMVYRKKEGFLMPISQWLYNNLKCLVYETLSEESLKKHGFFKTSYVRRLIDSFYEKEEDYRHANKIFSLLIFQIWYDLYFCQ